MKCKLVLSGFVALGSTSVLLGNDYSSYGDYSGSADASANSAVYTSTVAGNADYSGYDASANDSFYSNYDPMSSSSETSDAPFSLASFVPNFSYYEYLGPMKKKNGSGNATMTNWMTKFHITKATSKSWSFELDALFRMSWFEGKQDADMDVHRLYTIWLNMAANYNMWGNTYLTLGVNPEFSSDFDSWVARNFNMGGHLVVSSKISDTFSFSAGMAIAPQLGGSFPAYPYLGFKWQAAPNWVVELQGPRFTVKNKVTDYFSWGPFVSVISGSWVVKTEQHHARYEWRSGTAGIFTEIRLSNGKIKPKLLLDAGFSFANKGRFRTTNGRHTLSEKHYDPGFYMRAGIGFDF